MKRPISQWVKITDVIPFDNNPRNNDEAVDYIANSIQEFGFKNPIIVDKRNVIICGHTRLKAAQKLGLKEVPVIRATELSEEQVKAFRLADNKTGEFASWDDEKLQEELQGITEMDMEQFGFFVDGEDITEKKEDKPEVEFTEVLGEEHNYIVLYFDNEVDWLQAESLFDIKPKKNLSTRTDGKLTKGMERVCIGRVLNGAEAIEKLRKHYEDFR